MTKKQNHMLIIRYFFNLNFNFSWNRKGGKIGISISKKKYPKKVRKGSKIVK